MTTKRAEVDILAGVLWLTIGVGAGLLMLVVAPFGSGERSSPELLNGFVLAFAPLLALNRLYAPARALRAAPRGMEERSMIGGRAMLPTSAVHAIGPAAALVWADDGAALGAALTALLAASWWLFLEIQRRSRAFLASDAWTSRVLDRLENNYEIFAVSALWALAGGMYAAVSPDAIPRLMDYVVGVLMVGICGTSARAASSVIATSWRIAVLGMFAGLATVAAWRFDVWVRCRPGHRLVWGAWISPDAQSARGSPRRSRWMPLRVSSNGATRD